MSFIGVDLHTNSFTACRREADGSESFATFTLSPADLDRFCLTLDADDEVAFEATGGGATAAKLIAARELGLPVIMVRRPRAEPGAAVETVEAALDWLGGLDQSASARSMT